MTERVCEPTRDRARIQVKLDILSRTNFAICRSSASAGRTSLLVLVELCRRHLFQLRQHVVRNRLVVSRSLPFAPTFGAGSTLLSAFRMSSAILSTATCCTAFALFHGVRFDFLAERSSESYSVAFHFVPLKISYCVEGFAEMFTVLHLPE